MVKVTNGVLEREIREERLRLFLRLGYWAVPLSKKTASAKEKPKE